MFTRHFSPRSSAKRALVSALAILLMLPFANVSHAQNKQGSLIPILSLLLDEDSEVIDLPAAARFLTQATYGPRYDEIVALTNSSYEQWLDRQFALPPTLHIPYGQRIGFFERPPTIVRSSHHRVSVWNSVAMNAQDQLRQRMAFALSQIFVVSDRNIAIPHRVIANYYDLLVQNAFGTYRELLEKITLNEAMGLYLGMAGNQKRDLSINVLTPDENYAREILQLFSIGLIQLNLDGTPKLDSKGNEIPTYNQRDVEQLAKVFTGWHFDYISFRTYQLRPLGIKEGFKPLRAFQQFHDTSSKELLKVPGFSQTLPANQSAEEDLEDALDIIANHPNVAPFISKQLIQRFVTSNPTPSYVRRVATVFNNNGRGVRGDLKAVLRAILLDVEARQGHKTSPETFGKFKEPILRLTALWRGIGFLYRLPFAGPVLENLRLLNNMPLQAPTVFNFYTPDFSPSGKLSENGLLAPETQLLNLASVASMGFTFGNFSLRSDNQAISSQGLVSIDTLSQYPFVSDDLMDKDELIERFNIIFLSGAMPDGMRQVLNELHGPKGYTPSTKLNVINDLLYLTIISPHFYIQR